MMNTLTEQVEHVFSSIATDPAAASPFPTGRRLAENLGYPPDLLDSLPTLAVEAFCGVSMVPLLAEIPSGARVLDLGCGAGMDSLIAARQGASVVGVDFSERMLDRAARAVEQAREPRVLLQPGRAEALALEDSSFDVVLINGIFNLNPERTRIFNEVARVLRPGGRVVAAEIVLTQPLGESERRNTANWFS